MRIDDSYEKHIINEKKISVDKELPHCYTNPDSIDAWRHNRMRNFILEMIRLYPESKWITLGDGNHASDAYYLEQHGLDVTATSISVETLSIAKQLGYIQKYKAINAEKIDEADNCYDFVYCKEAYHHFPRPPIALYEMLRVASKGVVLIEPQESGTRILNSLKLIVKLFLRGDNSFEFEPTGNYIFRVNIKEIKKMMTSLNLRVVAYKKFNDFYHPKLVSKSSKGFKIAKLITLSGILFQNLLCRMGILDYGLAVVIIFKDECDDNIFKLLRKKGFKISRLPINPYLS